MQGKGHQVMHYDVCPTSSAKVVDIAACAWQVYSKMICSEALPIATALYVLLTVYHISWTNQSCPETNKNKVSFAPRTRTALSIPTVFRWVVGKATYMH